MNSCWSLMQMAFCSDTTWFQSGRPDSERTRAPLAGLVLGLAGTAMFGGCIVPYATPKTLDTGSRSQVTPVAQQGIEVGKTTRVDVLLALGEPDGRAVDDSWFSYGSSRSSGAGVFVFLFFDAADISHVNSQVSRLVIRFDASGLVADVLWQHSDCSGVHSAQCMDVRGTDLLAADIASGKMGTVLLNYNTASFSYSRNDYCTFANSGPPSYGPFALTDREIVMGETELSYSRIVAVLPFRKEASGVVRLKRYDGICIFIRVPGSEPNSVRVHDLILQQIQPVSSKSGETTP